MDAVQSLHICERTAQNLYDCSISKVCEENLTNEHSYVFPNVPTGTTSSEHLVSS